MEPDDRELLRDWRAGDSVAGNKLVRRHFRAVAGFFERRVDVRHLEELVQTTFLAAVESRDRVPDEATFCAYVLGIARNKMLMHLRSRRIRGEMQDLNDEGLAAGSMFRPSGFAVAREEQIALLRALRTLDLDLQIALELHYWEDMGTADIATVLSVPQGTVKTRLARARRRLKEAVKVEAATLALATSTAGDIDKWARSIRGKYNG